MTLWLGVLILSKTNALPLREEVPENLTWDLTTIYPNDEAWEQAFTDLQKSQKKASNLKGVYRKAARHYMKHFNFEIMHMI